MVNSVAKFDNPCTGCGACATVCPYEAISLKVNSKGFYVAVVNSDSCKNCGLCQKVCIRKEYKPISDIRMGSLFAAKSQSKETVLNCTSGGVAYELAIAGFRAGRIVVGTIYDYSTNCARSIIAHSESDILAMCGSKYIQAHAAECIKEVFHIASIHPHKEFIIFGTPCQIYAFNQVSQFMHIRDRFLLVDLFCHGVPSALVWTCYLDDQKKKTGVERWDYLRFRDPQHGWHNFVLSLKSAHNTVTESSDRCLFYQAFFDNILLNSACFTCPARCHGSGSDIRLGDFWGRSYQHLEDGVSAVLCLSENGRKAIENHTGLIILAELPPDECFEAQSIDPYPITALHEVAIDELEHTLNLKKTIYHYRRHFPFKKKFMLLAKTILGFLPLKLKLIIKRIIKGA